MKKQQKTQQKALTNQKCQKKIVHRCARISGIFSVNILTWSFPAFTIRETVARTLYRRLEYGAVKDV
jgi:hypothetical protein